MCQIDCGCRPFEVFWESLSVVGDRVALLDQQIFGSGSERIRVAVALLNRMTIGTPFEALRLGTTLMACAVGAPLAWAVCELIAL